jgi:hypothetical protein
LACQFGADWGCVGSVTYPTVSQGLPHLTVTFNRFQTTTPISGMSVSLCAGGADCSTPIDQSVTDSNGTVTLTDTVIENGQQGLNGSLQLSGADIYPTTVYWGFPLSEPNGRFDTVIPVFTVEDVNALFTGLVAFEEGKGLVAVAAVDCLGAQAPNVRIRSSADDAGASTLYVSWPALSEATGQTDSSGAAFIVNVPVGSIDLWATPVALGSTASHLSVYVQGNTLTEVSMAPTQ